MHCAFDFTLSQQLKATHKFNITIGQQVADQTAAWSAPELQRLSQAGSRERSRTKRCSRPAQAAAAADTLRQPAGGTTAVRPSLYAPRQKPTVGLSSASRPTVNSHLAAQASTVVELFLCTPST